MKGWCEFNAPVTCDSHWLMAIIIDLGINLLHKLRLTKHLPNWYRKLVGQNSSVTKRPAPLSIKKRFSYTYLSKCTYIFSQKASYMFFSFSVHLVPIAGYFIFVYRTFPLQLNGAQGADRYPFLKLLQNILCFIL